MSSGAMHPGFSPATTAWFTSAFGAPTAAQAEAWRAIADGDHTLVVAPTGSGKTLAAFLWSIDRLASRPPWGDPGVRILYISPLKALGVDVERNLRAPLAGIMRTAQASGEPAREVSIGVRSGDSSPAERRRLISQPPEILITTPESLFLLLTSAGGSILSAVDTVIIDEIHALAGDKRGSHLSLSLERLDASLEAPAQRIGLSATVRPIEEVARHLGGAASVTVVAPPAEALMDLVVEVPVEDMTAPPVPDLGDDPEQRAGSLWPFIESSVHARISGERSSIVFCNSRRLAERLTQRLNDLEAARGGEGPIARTHHGSVSKEERARVEEALKTGALRCVVATSSLELGIDMGEVDLVIQIDPPPSAASGLQRIGRAGHQVGAVSRAVIYPTHRTALLQAAAISERMVGRRIEALRIPANPLDVLA